MDQPPDELKTCANLIVDDISISSNSPAEELNNEKIFVGDAELESLKKEHVYIDEREQSIRMSLESASSPETKIKDLKTSDRIKNYEMVSTDSEFSSGVSSNSNLSYESVFETVSKIKVEQEYTEFGNFSRRLPANIKTENITLVGSQELENLITSNNSESSDFKGFPVKGKVSEKFSLDDLDGKVIETEAEPTCSGVVSKWREVDDNPLIKREISLDGTQERLRFTPKLPYRNSANPFEIVVPFVGKKPDWGDFKPFPHRYDLARERNRMKFEQSEDNVPEMSYHEMMKKRQARSKEEVEKDEQQELKIAASVAFYVAKKILIRILLQMKKEKPDEEAMIRYFKRFLDAPVSPVAMLYIPQFVHTVMYIRGSPFFSYKVRKMAERCYYRVHVMFPIPEGYNFETVYTSEVKKFLPEGVEGLHDRPMEYDELESPDESEDSAFSDNSESSD